MAKKNTDKAETITDERVLRQRLKYRSEALEIVIWLLMASFIIKDYVLKMPPGNSLVEFGIFLIALSYPYIRGMIAGDGEAAETVALEPKKAVAGIVATSAVIALVATVFNYWRLNDKYSGVLDPHFLLIPVIVFCFAATFGVISYGLMRWTASRAQKRIDRELEK